MGWNQARAVLLCGIAALALCGCRSGGGNYAATLGEAFTLDVMVLPGQGDTGGAANHLMPARFVVLADGTLHARLQADIGQMRLPGRIRRLTGDELDSLRALARDAIGDANVHESPIDLRLLHPPRDGTLIAMIMSDGGRRMMRRVEDDGRPSDEPVATLVDELAMLAWAGDLPAPQAAPGPVRYDLGPDPYARYRRGE